MRRLMSEPLRRGAMARVFADALAINGALITAFVVRFLFQNWLVESGRSAIVDSLRNWVITYAKAAPLLTSLGLIIFFLSGFYTRGRAYKSRYKAVIILQAVTLVYLIFASLTYLLPGIVPGVPRTVWVSAWLLTLLLIEVYRLRRFLWKLLVQPKPATAQPPAVEAPRTVVVVGGAGYVGSILCRQLLQSGHNVTAMDALLFGDDSIRDLYSNPSFRFIRGDLRNVESVVRALRAADDVVHLGGLVGDPACDVDEQVTLEVNQAATRMIAEAARGLGIERFVYASSCSVYGANQEQLDERSALNPVSLYARTKIESEKALLELADEGFAPVVLRFATLYGLSGRPRFDLAVNFLTAKALTERSITIYGGDQWRPFLHVADCVDAIVTCLDAPAEVVKSQVFNVGSDDENYRMSDIGELIADIIPNVEVNHETKQDAEANYRVAFAKIRNQLGFTCGRTVTDGIKEIQLAIEGGRVPDYQSNVYSNIKTLSQDGMAASLRRAGITPLYAGAGARSGQSPS